MKTILLPAAVLILLLASGPGYALMGIMHVDKDKAKELGIAVKTESVGESIYVRVEFESAKELTNFQHAQLSLGGNGRTLTTTIQPRKENDRTVIFFAADPKTVTDCEITLVVRHAPRSMTGYRIHMKDFVVAEKK
jgi:hypothetical protein